MLQCERLLFVEFEVAEILLQFVKTIESSTSHSRWEVYVAVLVLLDAAKHRYQPIGLIQSVISRGKRASLMSREPWIINRP